MTTTPILETERLRLRPHRREDYPAMKALWQDARVIRFVGGVAQDDEAVWFRLMRYAGMWALLGFGFWAFEDKASRAFIGEGGLLDAARGIEARAGAYARGWLGRWCRRRRARVLATEAMQAILAWTDATLSVPAHRRPDQSGQRRLVPRRGQARLRGGRTARLSGPGECAALPGAARLAPTPLPSGLPFARRRG